MNSAKCDEYDYINFLIGTQRVYSCVEASRVQREQDNSPAQDALNRLARISWRLGRSNCGLGQIKVFRAVSPHGDTEHWAANALTMSTLTRVALAERTWTIGYSPQGIKQFYGVERCQARAAKAQRHPIGLALRAFLCLERYCFRTGQS